MKYIYDIAYYGYEGHWNFYLRHTKKYSQEELQEILNNILDNYKLLIALDLLEDDINVENFIEMFDEHTDKEKWGSILTRCSMLEQYSKRVKQIFLENYGFESYTVIVEAEAFVSEMNKEDF